MKYVKLMLKLLLLVIQITMLFIQIKYNKNELMALIVMLGILQVVIKL